ncbi:MAG: Cof-type HAD-IIB family hydrolase [Bacillota bacterium]|nr:Cof-type HAD-IIB family hydrolase [Bacillota bacterium]
MELYISDLDGTLLTPEATITDRTRDTLNRLIREGLHFSVATARTQATVSQILREVAIDVPVILMNGACLYNLQDERYIKTEGLPELARAELFETLKKHQMEGFVYTIDDNLLSTWYERIDTPAARRFVAEREQRYGKVFTGVNDFTRDLSDRTMVYFSVTDRQERLAPLYADLARTNLMRVEFYRDVYQPGNSYLEICANTASKYFAVKYLREQYGFEKITCFGDNVNDLPMFEASDERYAVGNALPEVKRLANDVIGNNTEDGVAQWLSHHAGKTGVKPCMF